MKFFARFTKSKRTDNTASGSLQRKMYCPDESTKERVKEVVIEMLNEINRN